jgi:hypothetical protein
MLKRILFGGFFFFTLMSCDRFAHKQNNKVVKINKDRCSFELPVSLYLGKIDTSAYDEQGYFRILSIKSNNRMQLFVRNSGVDVNEELRNQIEALNTPDVFTAKQIDSLNKFGNYRGKGVAMSGTYEGGIVKGKINIFCYTGHNNGLIVVWQTINKGDTVAFKEVESSFLLK